MEVITGRPLALPRTPKQSHEKEKEEHTNKTVHPNLLSYLRISGQLAMQIKNNHNNKKLPWYYALRWRRKFYLGNRDPEPILVLVGKSDVEVERTGAHPTRTFTLKGAIVILKLSLKHSHDDRCCYAWNKPSIKQGERLELLCIVLETICAVKDVNWAEWWLHW